MTQITSPPSSPSAQERPLCLKTPPVFLIMGIFLSAVGLFLLGASYKMIPPVANPLLDSGLFGRITAYIVAGAGVLCLATSLLFYLKPSQQPPIILLETQEKRLSSETEETNQTEEMSDDSKGVSQKDEKRASIEEKGTSASSDKETDSQLPNDKKSIGLNEEREQIPIKNQQEESDTVRLEAPNIIDSALDDFSSSEEEYDDLNADSEGGISKDFYQNTISKKEKKRPKTLGELYHFWENECLLRGELLSLCLIGSDNPFVAPLTDPIFERQPLKEEIRALCEAFFLEGPSKAGMQKISHPDQFLGFIEWIQQKMSTYNAQKKVTEEDLTLEECFPEFPQINRCIQCWHKLSLLFKDKAPLSSEDFEACIQTLSLLSSKDCQFCRQHPYFLMKILRALQVVYCHVLFTPSYSEDQINHFKEVTCVIQNELPMKELALEIWIKYRKNLIEEFEKDWADVWESILKNPGEKRNLKNEAGYFQEILGKMDIHLISLVHPLLFTWPLPDNNLENKVSISGLELHSVLLMQKFILRSQRLSSIQKWRLLEHLNVESRFLSKPLPPFLQKQLDAFFEILTVEFPWEERRKKTPQFQKTFIGWMEKILEGCMQGAIALPGTYPQKILGGSHLSSIALIEAGCLWVKRRLELWNQSAPPELKIEKIPFDALHRRAKEWATLFYQQLLQETEGALRGEEMNLEKAYALLSFCEKSLKGYCDSLQDFLNRCSIGSPIEIASLELEKLSIPDGWKELHTIAHLWKKECYVFHNKEKGYSLNAQVKALHKLAIGLPPAGQVRQQYPLLHGPMFTLLVDVVCKDLYESGILYLNKVKDVQIQRELEESVQLLVKLDWLPPLPTKMEMDTTPDEGMAQEGECELDLEIRDSVDAFILRFNSSHSHEEKQLCLVELMSLISSEVWEIKRKIIEYLRRVNLSTYSAIIALDESLAIL